MNGRKYQKGIALIPVLLLLLALAIPINSLIGIINTRTRLIKNSVAAERTHREEISTEINNTPRQNENTFFCKERVCFRDTPQYLLCGDTEKLHFPVLDFDAVIAQSKVFLESDISKTVQTFEEESIFIQGNLISSKIYLSPEVKQIIVVSDIYIEDLVFQGSQEIVIISATGSLQLLHTTGAATLCPLAWQDLVITSSIKKLMPTTSERKILTKYSYISALVIQ